MKKFIYFLIIPIFVLFNERVFADTGTYTYKATIENCYFSDGNFYSSNGLEVYVYEIFGNDFSIEVISGNRLRVTLSPNYSTTCGLGSPKFGVFNLSNPSLNTPYTFTNSYTSFDHVYAYVFLSSQVGVLGSSNWGTSVTPPEPEPDLPYEYEFKGLIYVPEDDIYNKCYVVQNEDVIRAYDVVPALSTNYNYRDYYINSSYIYKDGSGQWSQYSTLPVCLASDILTNNLYYRLDFDRSLLIFFIISIFSIYLPIKLFSKIFRKGVL